MIKLSSEMESKKVEINLKGPQGNAFYLISLADSLGKALGMDKFRIKCIQDEMKLSDYEMLIQTFDKWFGDHVILYR
jgi:hypothetical protein